MAQANPPTAAEEPTGIERRTVLATAGALGTAALLAACSGSTDTDASSPTPAASDSGAGESDPQTDEPTTSDLLAKTGQESAGGTGLVSMQVLDRKLWRDLVTLRGQAFAIAAVMASGFACYIMFLSTLDSLLLSRALYYQDYRFAEIFAPLKRAPNSVRQRIAEINGVDKVDTRVVAPLTIDIEGFADPVTGYITSIPDSGDPLLNRIYLRSGRLVDAGRSDEVVISEPFAEAHGFQPGDKLHIIIRGKRKQLRIVGIGGSPEYIYQLAPGAVFPD